MARKAINEAARRLEVFGDMYWEMTQTVISRLDSMTDEELEQVIRDASEMDAGNCWWCTFEVAAFVLSEAKIKLKLRAWARERAQEAASTEAPVGTSEGKEV